jgi:hypothetical protein
MQVTVIEIITRRSQASMSAFLLEALLERRYLCGVTITSPVAAISIEEITIVAPFIGL